MKGNFSAPPLSPRIRSLNREIDRQVKVLYGRQFNQKQLRLKFTSRVKTIQASLQIEGNNLTEEQVRSVLDGKPVEAPPGIVLEIRNALLVYNRLDYLHPDSLVDFLGAHELLMKGLIEDAGRYRRKASGIQKGGGIVHAAPPADRVPGLMKELFLFIRNLEVSPLIGSCIFHYEMEFVHPFTDGNGRMGRLWQILMLYRWKPLFWDLAIESVIRDFQDRYYDAFNRANFEVHSGPFVEFMLEVILEALNRNNPEHF